MNQYEGYEDYDKMQDAFAKVYDLVEKKRKFRTPRG